MKAILCNAPTGIDDLVFEDIPEPAPGPGEVAVDVAFAALNFFDTLIVAGKYQFKPEPPFSPAAEFSGTVKAVGEGVATFKTGDRVAGYVGWGAAREVVVAPAERIVKVPANLSLEKAAGLIVTYGTTIHALIDRAGLKAGETLAVLGAAGGTGVAAIEIGKALGARVVACASSLDKLDFARQHGADATIDYERHDLKDALREATGGHGPEVIYDPVGGALADKALRAIRYGGRYLVIGFASGEIPQIALNRVLLKACDIRGVFWGADLDRDPTRHQAHFERLFDWAASGRITAPVDRVMPLSRAREALGVLARREAMGKILLQP